MEILDLGMGLDSLFYILRTIVNTYSALSLRDADFSDDVSIHIFGGSSMASTGRTLLSSVQVEFGSYTSLCFFLTCKQGGLKFQPIEISAVCCDSGILI